MSKTLICVICLCLMAVMLLSLGACGKKQDAKPGDTAGTATSTATEKPAEKPTEPEKKDALPDGWGAHDFIILENETAETVAIHKMLYQRIFSLLYTRRAAFSD